MSQFTDKVVVISGASQGAGKKMAISFYNDGASVCLLDINEEGLKKVLNEVKPDESRFAIYPTDISNSDNVKKSISAIGERFEKIDFLINNAGVLHKSTIEESTDEHLQLMVGVNLLGPCYCTREAVPYMKKNGGSIVNVSSILATFPNTASGAYGAAKAGMIIMTRVWAAELAPYNIRVNGYAPGVINTPMAEYVIKNRPESKLQQIALRRFGETDDVYDLVKFYCSDQSSYITGQTIGLDGGIWTTQTPTAAWKL